MSNTPICFITDNTYIIPTLTALESLYTNCNCIADHKVFVIVSPDFSEENRAALMDLHTGIIIIQAEYNTIYNNIPMGKRHVSSTALYKFNLPNIFTQYDKILYVDSDVIFLKDINDLLDKDLADTYAAVVETFSAPFLKHDPYDYLDIKHCFNSGMMLLNLKKMRDDNICERLLDYRLNGINYMMDQDSFNQVFGDKVIFLNPVFNLQYTSIYRFSIEEICELYNISELSSWDELFNKTVIMHFNSAEKPWIYNNTWKNEIWLYYYNHIKTDVRNQYRLERSQLNSVHQVVSTRPLVSVIVPVYNVEAYIEKCLQSICNQTIDDYEVICVDGGSEDNTIKIIEQYKKDNKKIKIKRIRSLSPGTARNAGLRMAHGKYIAFIDGDDYVKSDMLESMVYAAENKNAEIVCFPCYRFNNSDNKLIDGEYYLNKRVIEKYDVFSANNISENLFQIMPSYVFNKFYRTGFIRKHHLNFMETLCFDDMYFSYAGLIKADRICTELSPKYYHTQRAGSKNQIKWEYIEHFFKSVEHIHDILNNNDQKMIDSLSKLVIETAVKAMKECYNPKIRSLIIDNIFNEKFEFVKSYIYKKHEESVPAKNSDIDMILGAYDYKTETAATACELKCLAFAKLDQKPEISVIMPVYNTAQYLQESLDSILNQSVNNIELICIDDGSDDESLNILQKNASVDKRVSVYSQSHCGVSTARNEGIIRASGKYIYFIDSDDILKEDAFNNMLNSIGDNNIDVLYFNATPFYDVSCSELERSFKPFYQRLHQYPPVASGEEYFVEFTNNKEYIVTIWMCLYRRLFLVDNKTVFYPGIVHSDNLFTFITMMNAQKAMYISDNLYLRRIRPDSLMTRKTYFLSSYSYFILGIESLIYNKNNYEKIHDETKAHIYFRIAQLFRLAKSEYRKLSNYDKGKALALNDDYELFKKLVIDPVNNQLNSVTNQKNYLNAKKEIGYNKKDLEILRNELQKSRELNTEYIVQIDKLKKEKKRLTEDMQIIKNEKWYRAIYSKLKKLKKAYFTR